MPSNVPGLDVMMTGTRTETPKAASRSAAGSGDPAFDTLVGLAVATNGPDPSRPPASRPAAAADASPDDNLSAGRGAGAGLAGFGGDAIGAGDTSGAVPANGQAAAGRDDNLPAPDRTATPAVADAAPESIPGPIINPASEAVAPAATARNGDAAVAEPARSAATAPVAAIPGSASPDTQTVHADTPDTEAAVTGRASGAAAPAAPAAKPGSAKNLADAAAAKTGAVHTASPAASTGTTAIPAAAMAPGPDASGQPARSVDGHALVRGMDQAGPAAVTLPGSPAAAARAQLAQTDTADASPDTRTLTSGAQAGAATAVQSETEIPAQSQATAETPGQVRTPAAHPVQQQGQTQEPAPAQAQAQSQAQAQAQPLTGTATQPAAPATLSGADPATQSVAAASATNAAIALASPEATGRPTPTRQGIDERDGPGAAARSKGRPAKGQAPAADARTPDAAVRAQAQPVTSNTVSPSPDVTVKAGEPAPVQPMPAPALATASPQLPLTSADPVMTVGTDTATATARSGQTATADAANTGTPRFTPAAAAQLAAQISQRFSNGSRVFGIRLDPAELGRVDIRMELTHNNRVHATLTVERGDTLAELQRSTRDLERALNEAGLELAEEGLSFELGAGGSEQNQGDANSGQSFNIYGPDDDGEQAITAELAAAPADTYGFRLSRRDSVDVRV